MIEKLSQEEMNFLFDFFDSRALAECLFSDFDNLTQMDEDKLGHIRLAQLPLLSHEYILDDNPNLSKKQNHHLRKGAGDVYALGGRNFGKTLIAQKIDLCIRLITCNSQKIGYSSYDAIHIRGVLEEIVPALEHHPFLRLFDAQINRSPSYRISTRNGNVVEGINMNITGKEPGKQFFQKHLHALYIDECSMETEQVYKLRRDSVSEIGCVFRLSGMTDFTRYTPCGQVFYDTSLRGQVVNLPQYCIAEGSKILMSDFTQKNIEDIKVGDEILSFTEQEPFKLVKNKVTKFFNNGIKECQEISSEFSSLKLTENHKVLIKRGKWDIYWKKVSDLDVDKDKVYHLKHCYKNFDDYIEGVFLGLLECEGSPDGNAYSIPQKDELEALEWVLKHLKIEYTKYKDSTYDIHHCYIKVSNKKFINDLKNKLNNSYDLQLGFLVGFLIGDGCVRVENEKNKTDIRIGQKNKISELEKVLSSLKIKYSKFADKDGMFCYDFPRFEIPLAIPFSKKSEKYSNFILGSTLKSLDRGIHKKSDCGNQQVYDLETESHSYIANGFVVHNCNPNWDEKAKEKAIKDFSGENSIGYRVFIKGEIVEDGVCVVEGSRVLKSDFYQVPIERIEIGDELIAFSENTPRKITKTKVLDKICNGVREVVGVKSGDNELWLTPDHKVVALKRRSYQWVDIDTCLKRNYPVLSFNNLIKNEHLYYWGCLLGLIESDGTRIYDQNDSGKYSIYITQSLNCEWKAIEWILKNLGIQYSRYDVKSKNQYSDLYRYYIPRKHNSNIEEFLSRLKEDKDIAIGFISGFILGDGWIDKRQKLLKICQSREKNSEKCQLLEELFEIHNIKYFSYEKGGMVEYGFSRLEILPFIQFSYKIDKFRELLSGSYLWELAKPVVEIGRDKKKVYDLTTESHTFIAEGFCIHNSVFDMERVKKCYDYNKTVKVFEINKLSFNDFENLIFVEKPKNATDVYICADVGESAPTEIVVVFKIGTDYKYEYNITLYNLTDKEQFKVFKWLAETLSATSIGIDVTDGLGRAIYRSLEEVFPKENLVWCGFNEKIAIDFDRNEKGDIIMKDGKPTHKEEYVSEWSVKHLKDLLYNEKMILPIDYKLDKQINSVIAIKSNTTRTVYSLVCQDDHLFQAMQVFSIAEWINAFRSLRPITRKPFCKSGV